MIVLVEYFEQEKDGTSGRYRAKELDVPDRWKTETEEQLKTLVAMKIGKVSKIKSLTIKGESQCATVNATSTPASLPG